MTCSCPRSGRRSVRPCRRHSATCPQTRLFLTSAQATGIGTRLLARATAAQVVAIEPSLTMRAVLLSRIADDPDLRSRVTVLAGRAPDVLDEIDCPVAGFVCAHMLGHLAAAERRAMFTRLAGLLAPDGVGVITLPGAPGPGSEAPVEESIRIGRHRYVVRHLPSRHGRPAASEYLVLDADHIVRRSTFPSSWAPPSMVELQDELGHAGLCLIGDPTVVRVRLVAARGDDEDTRDQPTRALRVG